MKANTVETAADDSPADSAPALRRVGATVGLTFGFFLLTMFMAGEANASERDADTPKHTVESVLDDVARPTVEKVIEPVTDTVELATKPAAATTEPVAEAVEPVTKPVAEVTEPVVEPAAEAVEPLAEPVVKPVAAAVEPATRPVLSPVVGLADPVLESVSPVVKPVLGPVLRATEPAVAPITEAVGGEQAATDLGATPTDAVDPEPSSRPDTVDRHDDRSATGPSSVTPTQSGDHATTTPRVSREDSSDPLPPLAPTGDTTATTTATGSGGSHHTDSAVVTESSRSRDDSPRHRGPPLLSSLVECDVLEGGGHPS